MSGKRGLPNIRQILEDHGKHGKNRKVKGLVLDRIKADNCG
jgi:hypothetical protein